MSLPWNLVHWPTDRLLREDGGYVTPSVQVGCKEVASCLVTIGLPCGYAPDKAGPGNGHALSLTRGSGARALTFVVGFVGQPAERACARDLRKYQPSVWYARQLENLDVQVDSGEVRYRVPVFGTPGRLRCRLHQRHEDVPPPRWLAFSYLPTEWRMRYSAPAKINFSPWSCPVNPQADLPTPVRSILTVLAAHGQTMQVDPTMAYHWAKARSHTHQWCRLATAFNWLPGRYDIFVGYSSWQGLLEELDRGPVLVTLDWPFGALSSQSLGQVHAGAENLHLIVIGMSNGFVQLVDVTPGQEERIHLLSQSAFLRAWERAGGIIYHVRDRRPSSRAL